MRENDIIQIQSMQLNMQIKKRIRLILMQRNLQDTLTWWRSFRKEKPPTFVCVCVFVIEWAGDISECFFYPHHLSKSTLWSSSFSDSFKTFSNLLGNTQACKVLFCFSMEFSAPPLWTEGHNFLLFDCPNTNHQTCIIFPPAPQDTLQALQVDSFEILLV